jgi:hypothetical protein
MALYIFPIFWSIYSLSYKFFPPTDIHYIQITSFFKNIYTPPILNLPYPSYRFSREVMRILGREFGDWSWLIRLGWLGVEWVNPPFFPLRFWNSWHIPSLPSFQLLSPIRVVTRVSCRRSPSLTYHGGSSTPSILNSVSIYPATIQFSSLRYLSPVFFLPHCRMQQGDNYIEAATYIPYFKLPLTGNIFLSLFFLFLFLCVSIRVGIL